MTELLEQTAAFPRLRARLAAFQPGLDVESATSDSENPQDKVLVDRIRRLFVLKPADQNAQAPPVADVDDGRLEARRPPGADKDTRSWPSLTPIFSQPWRWQVATPW